MMPEAGNVLVGVLGVANIAGAVYLIRLVIAPLAASVKTLSDSVKELYESRNTTSERVTRIETIHEIRGCDQPSKKGMEK